MLIEPGPGETPLEALLRAQGESEIVHFWNEDEMIRIADCPRCIVCDGRRVWIGWRFWGGWRPCMICGGHGRMPFITPT